MLNILKRHCRHSMLGALTAGLLMMPVAASAADDSLVVQAQGRVLSTRTVEVSLAGLDLSRAGDRRILDTRLHGAARNVCGHDSINRLQEVGDYVACRDAAFQGARAEAQRLFAAGGRGSVVAADR